MAKKLDNADGHFTDRPGVAPAPAKESIPRISLTLTADGTRVDWTRVRPSTKEQLKQVLQDSEFTRPAVTSPPAESVKVLSDAVCVTAVGLLGQLQMIVAQRAYRCSVEDAAVLVYSEQEAAQLGPALGKVLDKYSTVWLTKYQDEAALALLVAAISGPKWIALQERIAAHTPRPAPTPFPSTRTVESESQDGKS